jgi:hypothetical protein
MFWCELTLNVNTIPNRLKTERQCTQSQNTKCDHDTEGHHINRALVKQNVEIHVIGGQFSL